MSNAGSDELARSLAELSTLTQQQFRNGWDPLRKTLVEDFQRLLGWELVTALKKRDANAPQRIIHRTPEADAWNNIGLMLIQLHLCGLAEALYEHARRTEHEFECEHAVTLHKGYSLHNLGVSQVLQGNWDDGLQNIQRALIEDEKSGVRKEDSHAYDVLHRKIIWPKRDYIKNQLRHRCKQNGLALITDQTIDDLFDSFDYEQRLFAAYTISVAMFSEPDTQFGRIRRLNALRDSCYLFESWFRKCGHQGNGLKACLGSAYGGQPPAWWSAARGLWDETTWAGTALEVQNQLVSITCTAGQPNEHDFLVRSHLYTGLMRNWTHHQFDPAAPVFRNYVQYAELLESVWICMAYAEATGV